MTFLGDDSAMATAIRAHDWAATPLGPIEDWPVALKTTVGLVVSSRFPQCIIWGRDLVTIPNDAFLPILGNKPTALGRSFAEVWSDAWSELGPIAERAFAGEATYIENFAMLTDRHGEQEEAHFTFCYSPIRDEHGAVVGVLDTVTETSAAVRADRHLQTANRELGHRLKNVLAITQAVALQTIRRSASLDQARESVSERLAALGRATDALTQTSWEAADLATLATAALAAHDEARIAIGGPPIRLASSPAISLALVLHELATNAAKYGALSNDSGRVDFMWTIEPGPRANDARLVLSWQETGGPAVSPPTAKGFGTTLIERTLKSSFKGHIVTQYRPEGLHLTLDAPLRGLSGASAGT